jgi:class 3 adenylate cyclase/tetratricopeptide (TPR) repeat protein
MMMRRSLKFASFTLDLDRLCLRGPSGQVDLRPKSFEVLRYLVEHAGRVGGKEEIIKAVWPDVIVTDESLTRCISEVRRAIGDESQKIIKTVPKRGYLFDVPIVPDDVQEDQPSQTTKTRATTNHAPSADDVPEVDRDAMSGERKQVTVLYMDLRTSLEIIAEQDPEEALKILEAVLNIMTRAVRRYEGTVNLETGDGILALFGVPFTHEDHAIRACYAALQIQEGVRRYSQRRVPGSPILVRAGLNSGEVVVRSIASGLRSESRAMGHTAHLATRLGQTAAPGTSLVSAATLRLAGGHFQVSMLEPPKTGLNEPVYELVGSGPAQTRFQALAARGLTSFVGRSAEMEHLRRVLARAEKRHGQLATIIGEPGLGKSRLLHEFIQSYPASYWRVLETASVSFQTTTSYLPVIELLKTYFKIAGSDDVREMQNKILGRLLELDEDLARELPALLSLLDLPVDDPSWPALDSSERRQRTIDALKRLILREAQRQPVILTFEDLHWIDSETQAFLETLIDGLASAPLLLILTYRPEYEHHWAGKSYYAQLRLDVLSPETTEEFLRNLVGDDVSLLELKDLLPKHGNPLFLEETVRMLVETNLLEGNRGSYRLVRPLHQLRLPPSVQAILAARVDRLPAREKRLLQVASVVGKDVPYAILQPIAGLGDDELRRGLAELRKAEFLYEARLFPDVEYTFKHALIQEAAYASLLNSRRQQLHARIALALEEKFADAVEKQPEVLAHHFTEAGRFDKAVAYWIKAGHRAARRSANVEAITCFDAALEYAPDAHAAATARLGKAGALRLIDQVDEALLLLSQAEPAFVASDCHRELAELEHLRGNLCFPKGQHEECRLAHQRALDHANKCSSVELRARALGGLGDAVYASGRLRTACHFFQQCVEIARQNALGRVEVANAAMIACTHAYSDTGAKVLHEIEAVISAAVAARQPRAELIAQTVAMTIHLWSARPHQVKPHFERAQEIVRAIGARRFEAENVAYMAEAHRQLGDRQRALALLEGSVAISRETGMSYCGAIVLGFQALAAADRPALHRAALEEGECLARRGYIAHNALYFGYCAIESCLLAKKWSEARRFADFLASAFEKEPVLLTEFLVERGRLLAQCGESDPSRFPLDAIKACWKKGMDLGYMFFVGALEAVLSAAPCKPHP